MEKKRVNKNYQVTLRGIYSMTDRVLVKNEGTKTMRIDPDKEAVYATGRTVKHNFKDVLYRIAREEYGIEAPSVRAIRLLSNTINKAEDKKKQCIILPELDISNPLQCLSCEWESLKLDDKGNSLGGGMHPKSQLLFGNFEPLHPNMAYISTNNKGTLTRAGRNTDKVSIVYTYGDESKKKDNKKVEMYDTPEAMLNGRAGKSQGLTLGECREFFGSTGTFVPEDKRGSGVYENWISFPVDKILRWNLRDLVVDSGKDAEYIRTHFLRNNELRNQDGSYAGQCVRDKRDGKYFLVFSDEICEKVIDSMARAMIEWEFGSNNATTWNPIYALRYVFGKNNLGLIKESTMGKLDPQPDGDDNQSRQDKAYIEFLETNKDTDLAGALESNGIKVLNSLILKSLAGTYVRPEDTDKLRYTVNFRETASDLFAEYCVGVYREWAKDKEKYYDVINDDIPTGNNGNETKTEFEKAIQHVETMTFA